MRRRDTFLGGGSILRAGRDGRLDWTSSDPAGPKNAHKPSKRWGEKVPTQEKIERQSKEDEIAEGKLIRSFISQCATAYAMGKLDASFPMPPKSLKRLIKGAGGNVAWLEADRSRQAFFHKALCRIIGNNIPVEKVWARPGIHSTKRQK